MYACNNQGEALNGEINAKGQPVYIRLDSRNGVAKFVLKLMTVVTQFTETAKLKFNSCFDHVWVLINGFDHVSELLSRMQELHRYRPQTISATTISAT